MALDITAYKNLVPAPGVSAEQAEDEYDKYFYPGPSMEWSESIWPGRAKGIEPSTAYTFADSVSMRAGSYGGYNSWRRQLADFADTLDGSPFEELINFADNEGVIGPIVSAKLLADFTVHAEAAKSFAEKIGGDAGYWVSKYAEWQKVFSFAAEAGAVYFH
jgi:hypothetical protein